MGPPRHPHGNAVANLEYGVFPVLTTGLLTAAVLRLVDHLLSRLSAVYCDLCWALNGLTLDAHGVLVANTLVAATDPCVTRLQEGKGTAQKHTIHIAYFYYVN